MGKRRRQERESERKAGALLDKLDAKRAATRHLASISCPFHAPGTELRLLRHRCERKRGNSSSKRAGKVRAEGGLACHRGRNSFADGRKKKPFRNGGRLVPFSSPLLLVDCCKARHKTMSGVWRLPSSRKARKGATFFPRLLLLPISLE